MVYLLYGTSYNFHLHRSLIFNGTFYNWEMLVFAYICNVSGSYASRNALMSNSLVP